MDDDDQENGLGFGFSSGSASSVRPALVSLSPFTPTGWPSPPRRLSSCFTEPRPPVRSAARKLAWVSLQGRLVDANEASSARAIGGGLSPQEAVAWELFTPIHRFLIVAVVAVAAANSKKNKQIFQLKNAVDHRDQVLLSMQQKLDNLCEQLNYQKNQPLSKNAEITFSEEVRFSGCSCQHQTPLSDVAGNSIVRPSNGEEICKYKMPLTDEAEPEERRMSDLSDWAPSVSSSMDTQLNPFAIEQDIHNLRKDCEEKDVTIKQLSSFINSSEVGGAKRIAELEDIIRRRNMTISKLKKDMFILEQKLVNLTRLRRSSFSTTNSGLVQCPVMADNLLYDMDNTTSPSSSSSDSDCSPRSQHQAPIAKMENITVQNTASALREAQKPKQKRNSTLSVKTNERLQNCPPVSPLKEKSLNPTVHWVPHSRSKQSSSGSGSEDQKSKRRASTRPKDVAVQKRWM